MKNKINLWAIAFTVFNLFFLSCQKSGRATGKEELYVANLDSMCVPNLELSSIFDSVSVCVLDNDAVLIGDIRKFVSYGDNLYLMDARNQVVYAFGKDGRFLCSFGNRGPAPGEYAACMDFALNVAADELCLYDHASGKLLKYDLTSGCFKNEVPVDAGICANWIACIDGELYAAQTYHTGEDNYYLLHQIDMDSGREKRRFLNAHDCNKGWNDAFVSHQAFYHTGDADLFVMGLMDTVRVIKGNEVCPYLAIQSKHLATRNDVSQTEEEPSAVSHVRSRQMHELLMRLLRKNRTFLISNLFEHNHTLYFQCMGRNVGWVQYDLENGATVAYSCSMDDVLFDKIPEHYMLPVYLGSDSQGVYMGVRSDYVAEMKSFEREGYLSGKVKNKERIESLNEDSNPVILYYEFKK